MTALLIIAAILAVVAALHAISARLLLLPHSSQEPPLVTPRIPVIGHLLGVIWHGLNYYSKVTEKCRLPIYTLQLPRSKIYIVNSMQIVSTVDRHAKTLSFAPFFAEVAKRIMGASQDAVEKFAEDLLGDNDVPALRQATLRAMHSTLTQRKNVESMTNEAVTSLNGLIDPRAMVDGAEATIDLFSWIRRVITIASTDSVYGTKHNPFRDDEVREGFWAFDDDFAKVGINILPSIIAPAGIKGRAILEEALRNYYKKDGQLSASKLVQARLEVNRGFDITPDDIARFDVGVCHGLLSNIVPGASWVIYYVFSDPELLQAVRCGIWNAIDYDFENMEHSGNVQVNMATIMARCPIISSLVKETLRMQSTNAAFRVVLEDTMIDGHLLKKDALLFIPSADIHRTEEIWGPTATNFDPTRFVKEQKMKSGIKPPAAAYRAWGCGAAICPGRYFATNELVAFLVIMALKYDICPLAGRWSVPRREPHIGAAIVSPGDKIEVSLKEREDMRGMTFEFCWDGPGR